MQFGRGISCRCGLPCPEPKLRDTRLATSQEHLPGGTQDLWDVPPTERHPTYDAFELKHTYFISSRVTTVTLHGPDVNNCVLWESAAFSAWESHH